jgi:hypothetical protein
MASPLKGAHTVLGDFGAATICSALCETSSMNASGESNGKNSGMNSSDRAEQERLSEASTAEANRRKDVHDPMFV